MPGYRVEGRRGPFEVQPGDPASQVIATLGDGGLDEQDKELVEMGASPEVWRQSTYYLMTPVQPFKGYSFSEASVSFQFRYRAENGVVWSVAIANPGGICALGLGKLLVTTPFDKAHEILGTPLSRNQILIRSLLVWEDEGLIYEAEYYDEAHQDSAGWSYAIGDPNHVAVISVADTYPPYLAQLRSSEPLGSFHRELARAQEERRAAQWPDNAFTRVLSLFFKK